MSPSKRSALVREPGSKTIEPRADVPAVPAAWMPRLRQLAEVSRHFARGPAWWTPPNVGFFGKLETRERGSAYHWDGVKRFAKGDRPFFLCQLTLAGWGQFEPYDEPPRQLTPGTAFFVTVPSRHRYYLPASSPGWTFCWLAIDHSYVLERTKRQIAASGSLLELEPGSALVASATRLVRGTFRKDFRDRLEVELALFEFMLGFERLAQRSGDPRGERDRLLEVVRERVLSQPKRALKVDALADEHGMSRAHFSQYFRAQTSLTPARFIAETRVGEAARLLVETSAPLKQIADACGFANVNHFGKVFRRFHHRTPAAYRRALAYARPELQSP